MKITWCAVFKKGDNVCGDNPHSFETVTQAITCFVNV